ncbi:SAM-dependent methyltransferase [Gigaspora margarita]|uniref:SAM-dependent methyltransferase n=1 Tax=Gigaspora margarita TaxID=4874 RepID=A0A8H4AGU4_GIGMA|nr:SAM-dependent methyltransferase [Gigaspora margarita]
MSEENKKFKFTYDWFTYHIQNWEKYLFHLKNENINVLEIGTFEGRSAIWILEELFKNSESKLISIDPFEVDKFDDSYVGDYEAMFRENVKITGKEKQVEIMKSLSLDALIKLNHESKIKFDFIHIDGSHVACDVLTDAVLAWNLLKDEGIMILDDYEMVQFKEEYNNPKIAIDAFIKCYEPKIDVIHKGYQIIIKKVNRERKETGIDDFPENFKQTIMKFYPNFTFNPSHKLT